jgi:beta-fructofuranosidase
MIDQRIPNRLPRIVGDVHRPTYHYLPPRNWMNDPNGVICWRREYHLFYQHNPMGANWGNMHWGHAVSPDLIHWTDLPMALAPTPGGPDEAGCFSGCAVNNGLPTLLYTGVRGERFDVQTQCMATSADGLLTWDKHPQNPVLCDVPPESGQTADFRDPFVWKDGNYWYMVVGSRINGQGGAVFLYRSQFLTVWEYLNPLFIGDGPETGVIWECPNFFKLGERWVLIISAHAGSETWRVLYFVGDYDNHCFTPTSSGVLDYDRMYAPLSMLDENDRRVLFGWIREARSDEAQRQAGWSGVQSIPRVLTLDAQDRLNMTPVPELNKLRAAQHQFSGAAVSDSFLPVTGRALDIEAAFSPEASHDCGIALACSPDGAEKTEVRYDASSRTLRVVMHTLSAAGTLDVHAQQATHPLDDSESLELRILLDGSVVEIIANQRTSITIRIYPSKPDSHHIRIIQPAALKSLDIWNMKSIWP